MAEETPLPEAYSPPSPAWRAAFSPQTTAAEEVSMSPMQRELDRRIAFLESQLRENAPKDHGTAAEVRPRTNQHDSTAWARVEHTRSSIGVRRPSRSTD